MYPILIINKISKSFQNVTILKDISFSLQKQTITLISGENGTGKTSIFNVITGLEKSNTGSIIFKNCNLKNMLPLKIAQLGIGRLYQQPRIFKNLLVRENLVAAAHTDLNINLFNQIFKYNLVKKQQDEIQKKAFNLLEKFKLDNLFEQKCGELSYGQQKLISFCMLVMNNTQLALLDEPFAGLNPAMIDKLITMIIEMKKQGVTFVIIEHNAHALTPIIDHHLVLKNGVF